MIEPVTLSLPHLPPGLEGLTIAHVSDLHIRRRRPRFRRVAALLGDLDADLCFFTGDYMSVPGDEAVSLSVMEEILDRIRPRLGSYGVFGNHDSADLRRQFDRLPVHWLNNSSVWLDSLPVRILGFHCQKHIWPDSVATLSSLHKHSAQPVNSQPGDRPHVEILLCHFPTFLPTAADMGIDLMFSGHTHGGQCRLPGRRAIINSTDLPADLSSGLLRHKDTVCAVTRGLGETLIPMRLFCPPHLPVYTLCCGPLPGRRTPHIENVVPW